MAPKEPEERQILRYWLAAVRQEESLASRPRPQKPTTSRKPPNLIEPAFGQPYFRFGAEHAAFLTGETRLLSLPLDDARMRFFERWLRTNYRNEARGEGASRPQTFVA